MATKQRTTTDQLFKSRVADVFIATRELSDFCEANPQYREILDDAITKATAPRPTKATKGKKTSESAAATR